MLRRAQCAPFGRDSSGVERFPEVGLPTKDPGIRQIVVRFGRAGYIARYTILPANGAVFVTRIWHTREARE